MLQYEEPLEIDDKSIVQMKLATNSEGEIAGNIFFVSGHFGDKDYYKMYVKSENGAIKLISVPARNTVIYEKARNGAVIAEKILKSAKYPTWVTILFVPKFMQEDTIEKMGHIIHVPKDTIKKSVYNIDL